MNSQSSTLFIQWAASLYNDPQYTTWSSNQTNPYSKIADMVRNVSVFPPQKPLPISNCYQLLFGFLLDTHAKTCTLTQFWDKILSQTYSKYLCPSDLYSIVFHSIARKLTSRQRHWILSYLHIFKRHVLQHRKNKHMASITQWSTDLMLLSTQEQNT